MSKVLDQVFKTTIDLILEAPFYGHFLTGLLKEVTTDTATLSLALVPPQSVLLRINPEFWQRTHHTPSLQFGAIKHELLHLVFKHILMGRDFPHQQIFYLAADLVVNQYLLPHELPKDAILLSRFAELNLEPNREVGYYYRKLLASWQAHLQDDLADPKGTGKFIQDTINGFNPNLEKHKYWLEDAQKLRGMERNLLDRNIEEILKNSINRTKVSGMGKLPGQLRDYLLGLNFRQRPEVNWRRVLRLFAAGSRRTRLKNTIRRPSKRYGTNPGIKVKRYHRLLIAVDTSGSIDQQSLTRFFEEIYHIWRQGTEVYVVECDTQISHQYAYRGVPPKFVTGRGGTAFEAPIIFANDKFHPDALIYFTDGFGPIPRVASRQPILWLITKNGININNPTWKRLPGRQVKMTN